MFVIVLSYSRHQFARICFDQKIETWLSLHIEAFEWFGGLPEVVVPDNLKAAVIRAEPDRVDRWRSDRVVCGTRADRGLPEGQPGWARSKRQRGVVVARRAQRSADGSRVSAEGMTSAEQLVCERSGGAERGRIAWLPMLLQRSVLSM